MDAISARELFIDLEARGLADEPLLVLIQRSDESGLFWTDAESVDGWREDGDGVVLEHSFWESGNRAADKQGH